MPHVPPASQTTDTTTPVFAACFGWSTKFLAKIVSSAMLLLTANTSAQASAELFASLCSGCHNNVRHPRELVYNAAGNAAIIAAVNALGMGAGGSGADQASIAAYLDTIKPAITMAPVAHNSPGTVISLRDIKVPASVENAHLKIIGSIVTVSPPMKGTVTYNYALGFNTPSNVVYTPFPGQSGEDTWTYRGIAIDAKPALDTTVRTASVNIAPSPTAAALNFQGLWYRSPAESEAGWGVNIAHQGDTFFVTWFTYDTDGSQMWLVGPDVRKAAGNNYSGTLFRTTGPPFNSVPFTPIGAANVTQVGTVTFSFNDSSNGTFSYTLNGITQSKPITRQLFGPLPSCTAGGTPGIPIHAQDIWYASPAESEAGWGVNITQQGDILFVTWFTYDASGRGMWVVGPRFERTAGNTFAGPLYRTTGPAFSANPWNPAGVAATQVGAAMFTFTAQNSGTFGYTVDNVTQTRAITRQVFGSPATVCR
jgi:hypothetical protein